MNFGSFRLKLLVQISETWKHVIQKINIKDIYRIRNQFMNRRGIYFGQISSNSSEIRDLAKFIQI